MQCHSCLLVLLVGLAANLQVHATNSPIVFVHGITASQLETRHTSDSVSDPCLFGADGWEGVWISLTKAFAVSSDCLLQGIMLDYNSSTRTHSDAPGVDVRVAGFEDISKAEYLDTEGAMMIPNAATFVQYFVDRGYERDKTIRTAPYDWRLAAGQLEERGYYTQLRTLVEEMYEDSDNTTVTIVISSMGGPVTLYFFNEIVTQEWKDQYIHAYVPLSGAWAGATHSLDGHVSGFSAVPPSYCDLLDCSVLRPFVRSLQSLIWLIPHPSIWEDDRVLVTTPDKTYTVTDYAELYEDMGYPDGYNIFMDVEGLNAGFPAPNVPVYCFYGVGVDTIETLDYDSGFPDTVANITYGEGDGIVNMRSLEVCLSWANEQSQPFTSRMFNGVHHNNMTSNPDVLEAIEAIVVIPEVDAAMMTVCTRLTVIVAAIIAYICSY